MDKSIFSTVSGISVSIATLGALVTIMVVIFRTGKRLGEAENKINNVRANY